MAKQPCGIAAGTAQICERRFRRLDAGFKPDEIFDVFPKPLVDANEEIIRARPRGLGSSRGQEARTFVMILGAWDVR